LDPALPFSRSYWVIPGKFLAGAYPGSIDSEEAKEKIKALIHSGIRSVINLMEKDEVDGSGNLFSPYEEAFLEMGKAFALNLTCQRFPIKDLNVPSPLSMNRILNEIDSSLSKDRPVFVHCWGGRGRTGMVVCCYLVRTGLSGQEALEKIKDLRQFEPTGHRPSPETNEQRKLVISWAKLDQRA
jgi:protein-tyrosine phosphatase